MKRWTQIFKVLANINRLKIVKLLFEGQPMTVADISREIRVSFKGTSKHLILLHNLDILSNQGKDGHVYYAFNHDMPSDIKRVVQNFLR